MEHSKKATDVAFLENRKSKRIKTNTIVANERVHTLLQFEFKYRLNFHES